MLVVCLAPSFAYFSQSGMETPAVTLTALLAICAVRYSSAKAFVGASILGVGLFLLRPELVLVLPLFVCIARFRALISLRNFLLCLFVFFLAVGLITLWRYHEFGVTVPNTAIAKTTSAGIIIANMASIALGNSPNLPASLQGILGVSLMIFCLWMAAFRGGLSELMTASIVLVGLAFAVYSPPDWTDLPRYFAPIIPVAAVLVCYAAAYVFQEYRTAANKLFERFKGLSATPLAIISSILISASMAYVAACAIQAKKFVSTKFDYPGYVLFSTPLIDSLKEWGNFASGKNVVIATRRIGVVGYVTNATMFDYKFGLIHPDIAKLIASTKIRSDSPNDPRLAEYWHRYNPDFVLEDNKILEPLLISGSKDTLMIQGIKYRISNQRRIGTENGKDVYWTLAKRVAP
jgi:hypothetical protein